MALSESIEYDKIEVVGIYKAVQVRVKQLLSKKIMLNLQGLMKGMYFMLER